MFTELRKLRTEFWEFPDFQFFILFATFFSCYKMFCHINWLNIVHCKPIIYIPQNCVSVLQIYWNNARKQYQNSGRHRKRELYTNILQDIFKADNCQKKTNVSPLFNRTKISIKLENGRMLKTMSGITP